MSEYNLSDCHRIQAMNKRNYELNMGRRSNSSVGTLREELVNKLDSLENKSYHFTNNDNKKLIRAAASCQDLRRFT